MPRVRNSHEDTNLGGSARAFPSTHGSLVSDLAQPAMERRRRAVEQIARRYWKPIYRYVRLGWSKSNEEAKDLTQAFLLWLLESDRLAGYSRQKGRFRPFFKLVLRRFLGHEDEAARRLKKGGGVRLIPLEEFSLLRDSIPDPAPRDPDREFDRSWGEELARRAVERVRDRLIREGKELRFRAYEAADLRSEGKRPGYARIARELGVTEDDVRNHLREVRGRVRAEVRAEMAGTVSRPVDLEAEWRDLFGA